MNRFIDRTIDWFLKVRGEAGDIFGIVLPWLEFFAVIASAVLIFGIIYAVVRSNWLIYRIDEWIDILGAGDISKRRTVRGWRQIVKRLHEPDPQSWKLSVLEADKILHEILKINGYKFDTVHEQLGQVTADFLPNVEELKEAHKLRDRLAHEPGSGLTRDEAVRIVRVYAKAFRELGLID